MTKTFEVGKKYTTGNRIYECKHVGKTHSMLEEENHTAVPLNYMLDHKYGWKEFKEPVIKKTTKKFITGDGYIDGFAILSSSSCANIEPDALIEFTLTDGKLTNVEIVK